MNGRLRGRVAPPVRGATQPVAVAEALADREADAGEANLQAVLGRGQLERLDAGLPQLGDPDLPAVHAQGHDPDRGGRLLGHEVRVEPHDAVDTPEPYGPIR